MAYPAAITLPAWPCANDTAKLDECNKWVDVARPIVRAMLMIDGEVEQHLSPLIELSRRDWGEAREVLGKAYNGLWEMLDGIRENFICDQRIGGFETDAENDAADEFNEWLDENTTSVMDAVKLVIAERRA